MRDETGGLTIFSYDKQLIPPVQTAPLHISWPDSTVASLPASTPGSPLAALFHLPGVSPFLAICFNCTDPLVLDS